MCLAAAAGLGSVLSAIGGIAGAMVSAAGAQQQADAQAQKANYEAAVARNNATAEAYKGTAQAEATAEQGKRVLAQQRAAFGASGAQVDTGSPVTVFGESSARLAGDVSAQQYGGKIQSQRWQDQAVLHDMEAANARKAGQIASMGAIIGGVGSIGKMFGGGAGSSVSAFG